jgi:hypothetical protein
MAIFRKPKYEWPGGEWVRLHEINNNQKIYDFYKPINIDAVKANLDPLDKIMKKTCYIAKRASVSYLLAKKFVEKKKVVRARYF